MKENLLDLGSGARAHEGDRKSCPGTNERQGAMLESAGAEWAEKKIAEIEKRVLASLTERLDSQIADKVEKALDAFSSPSLLAKMKDMLTGIVQAVLFDSGLVEKVVLRALDRKLKEANGDGAQGEHGQIPYQKEIERIAQKQVEAAFSGEAVKLLIDDKFRSISLYLKTEVVPKVVAQAMRQKQPEKQPEAAAH